MTNLRATKWLRAVALLALAFMTVLTPAFAQSGGDYDLTWSTMDGGGETFSVGGDYTLGGTVGQPDAGVLAGGEYTLSGGFWGWAVVQYTSYLPLILRKVP